MSCRLPTGGYELELIAFMHKSGVPVAYTDALRVRQFVRAEGCLSKNDTIDAALISRFADKIGARTLEAQEVEAVELKRRAKFRQTMVDSRTAMMNRLETETDAGMKALLKEQTSGTQSSGATTAESGRRAIRTSGRQSRPGASCCRC